MHSASPRRPDFNRPTSFLIAACLWLASSHSVRAVVTDPPPPQVLRLAEQAMPDKDLLPLPVSAAAPGDSGVTLLDERLLAVDDQGRRTILYHFAYKTLTDAGIKSNSEDVYSYRKHQQKIYLLRAETIQPDGTRQPVQPDAVLIQSPQRQAEYSLYDDRAELKIIFPNVVPGSITHGIVVVEDLVPRFPGEFSQRFTWSRSWGLERLHFVADLPAAIAARLKVEAVGQGVPKAGTRKLESGQVRYTWSGSSLRGEKYETERAPASQVGPGIHLTSIPTWDDVGRWYAGMLESRHNLGPELKQLAEEWTRGCTGEAEQIAALHAQVADEVRYVGLELGQADFQPHDCNEVWANRYGDCKDKANLLAALLRHRGIAAYVALLNTDHLGLVDRRVPDYQIFTHAIVAIPQGKGYLFCDPTIASSTPGQIGTSSADRDVLVIRPDGAQWMRTPAATAGTIAYEFDLKLRESGELAGWLTITSDGVYGASERHRSTRLERQDLRSRLSQTIRGFYAAAEVVDATCVESPRGQPMAIKAYFTVPATPRDDLKKHALTFPSNAALLPDIGDTSDRQTSYFMTRDRITVTAAIALPGDYQPLQDSPDFQLDAPVALLKGRWRFQPRLVRTELDLTMKRADVRREDFGRFYQGMQSLQAWLARPVLLQEGAAKSNAPKPTAELDFPQMPSGDGQISLADQRYPENGDPDLRRRALERTIQYFPQDKNTVLRASVRLAIIDWNAGRTAAAHERLVSLLAAMAGLATPENYAWAESLDGVLLRELKRPAEALALLERVSRDTRLSANRRAQAGVEAAEILAQTSVQSALDLLLEIAALPDGATARVEAGLARLYLGADRAAELEAHWRALVASRPDSCENELTEILHTALDWKEPDAATRLHALAGLVGKVRPTQGEALAAACREVLDRGTMRQLYARVQAELAGPVLKAWSEPAETLPSLEAYTKAIEAAGDKGEAATAFRLCLSALGHQGPDETFPQRLWRAGNYADWVQRQGKTPITPAVADLLLTLCTELPPANDYFVEGQLLRATRLKTAGDAAGEKSLLFSLLDSAATPPGYSLHVLRRLVRGREEAGDYTGALELCRRIEPFANDYRTAAESLLRAVFINLHLGHDAEALRLLEVLRKVSPDTLKQAEGKAQLDELLLLAQGGRATEVWQAGRSWWPQWRKLAAAGGGATETTATVIPVIPDLVKLGTAAGEARRDKNAAVYFQTLDLLFSAARWLPSLGVEIGSMYTVTMEMLPAPATDLRPLVIAILKGPHPEGVANLVGRQLQLAIHCIDGGVPADALKVIAEFELGRPSPGAVPQAMHRLRGLAALAAGQDLAATAAALAADLSDPLLAEQRPTAVRILADLYHQLGRLDEEEKLLQRELANNLVTTNTEMTKTLQARLTRLVGERDYGKEIDKWQQAVSIPWYDFAAPQSLEDPRLANLDDVLASPGRYFVPAEQVKLHLLAAKDLRRTLSQRQESFRRASQLLIELAPTYTRFNRVAASVIDNRAFPVEITVNVLWLTLLQLASEDRKDDYQHWRKHELCEQFNETTRKNLALVDLVVATDRSSSESVQQAVATVTGKEINNFGGFVLSDLFDFLLTIGDFPAAERFISQIPAWKLALDVQGTAQARALDYARRLRRARSIDRVEQAMVAVTKAKFPALADSLPAAYTDLRRRTDLARCSLADTRQACLYLIKTRRYSWNDFDFWGQFLRSLVSEPGVEIFAGDLLGAGLAAADSDEMRGELVLQFTGGLDVDNPVIREQLHKVFVREIDPKLYPGAFLRLRLYEAKVADRLGELTEVETALAGVTDPSTPFFQQAMNFEIYTRRGNLPEIKRALDRMKTEFLLSPGMVGTAMSAFAQLGLTDELAVARDTARTEARKSITQSWASQENSAVTRALHLAEKLADPSLLPEAWVSEIVGNHPDPFLRQTVAIYSAQLRKDWKQMEVIGREINRDAPTHYHYYWLHGLASAQLGHKKEALEALRMYTRYSKDEEEFPRAVQLLKELDVK